MFDGSGNVQHVFIIGAKSIGQYGGFETFVDKLTEYHQNEPGIKYHIACKANGDGAMDESKLTGVSDVRNNGPYREFTYHNAHIFKLPLPAIGNAVAIYYDIASLKYSIQYCLDNGIQRPIFYILACRIGPVMRKYKKLIKAIDGRFYLNPDGHEWKREKWSPPVRKYWKLSERLMVKHADKVICDSTCIEQYIKKEYRAYSPKTVFISYGAEVKKSSLADDNPRFVDWLNRCGLSKGNYYLAVGRFVPENNYETMIREYMKCDSTKHFVIVANSNEKFLKELEAKLHFSRDPRIVFPGPEYDHELIRKIRECAYAYVHGHSVGGTNPSLLEALGSTRLNLLFDVEFNREVGQDAALYWSSKEGQLAALFNSADKMSDKDRQVMGERAIKRITDVYNWELIAAQYSKVFIGKKKD